MAATWMTFTTIPENKKRSPIGKMTAATGKAIASPLVLQQRGEKVPERDRRFEERVGPIAVSEV